MTVVFDRAFDDGGNFDLTDTNDPSVVAAVKRNRRVISEAIDAVELDAFQKSYETSYGTCYVTDAGSVDIGEHTSRLFLSYHDSTREKRKAELDTLRADAEEVLSAQLERLERGGRGRPPTANSVRRKLRKVLGNELTHLEWSFD